MIIELWKKFKRTGNSCEGLLGYGRYKKIRTYGGLLNYGRYLKVKVRLMKDYWILMIFERTCKSYEGLLNYVIYLKEKQGPTNEYCMVYDI